MMLLNFLRRLPVVVLGLAATPAIAHPAVIQCPAHQAIYVLPTDDRPLEIGFIPATNFISAASDLYLYLGTTQRTYWFTFSVSNGYSGMTLHPVSDPGAAEAQASGPLDLLKQHFGEDADDAEANILPSLRFYSLDSDLTFLFDPPLAGQPAPAYVMVSEMGLTLWYEPKALTEDPAAERDSIPRGIFQLAECLTEPRQKVLP